LAHQIRAKFFFIPRAPIVRKVRSLGALSQSAFSIHRSADSEFTAESNSP